MSMRPTQHFYKGQIIIEEGERGEHTYKILDGDVVVCMQNEQKDLIPIAKLTQGEIFGEMYLFDGNGKRGATVIAASNHVEVEVFFRDEMDSLVKGLNPAALTLMKGYNKRLKTTSVTCASLVSEHRYSKLPDGTAKQSGFTRAHHEEEEPEAPEEF